MQISTNGETKNTFEAFVMFQGKIPWLCKTTDFFSASVELPATIVLVWVFFFHQYNKDISGGGYAPTYGDCTLHSMSCSIDDVVAI